MSEITVLFDLDDTLLCTNMDRFLPGYFKLLGKTLNHLGSEERITYQIQFAVEKMVANTDPCKTLKEVFDQHFYEPLGTTEETCKDKLNTFYRNEFPHLKGITQTKPEASDLVAWCQSMGMTMVIATNPLFPRTATHQRIQWAGLNPKNFAFYTTYEDFHFTKPNLTYYAEVLARLGWPEGTSVMIGDSLTLDLLPMKTMGYQTFLVNPNNEDINQPSGTISDVKPWMTKLDQNNKRINNHREVNLAILQSTPAVIDSWLRLSHTEHFLNHLNKKSKQLKPALVALIKFEREIIQAYLEKFRNKKIKSANCKDPLQKETKIPNPDGDIQSLLCCFLKRRSFNLAMLNELLINSPVEGISNPDRQESQKLDESITAFAQHDRKLLRTCVNMLNIYKIY